MTATEALLLVARSSFRPFDKFDFQSFSGTESAKPMIHYADEADESYTIILDGNRIVLVDIDGVELHFLLGENIFA